VAPPFICALTGSGPSSPHYISKEHCPLPSFPPTECRRILLQDSFSSSPFLVFCDIFPVMYTPVESRRMPCSFCLSPLLSTGFPTVFAGCANDPCRLLSTRALLTFPRLHCETAFSLDVTPAPLPGDLILPEHASPPVLVSSVSSDVDLTVPPGSIRDRPQLIAISSSFFTSFFPRASASFLFFCHPSAGAGNERPL